jgi:hypothetical protein
LVLQLYTELFNDTTGQFLTQVSNDIEYLWNHKAIKKTKLYKKKLRSGFNFLKNFVLLLIR